jgi:hypothetical protein
VKVDREGYRYEGDWVKGKKEGKGAEVSTGGNRFEGDWADDHIEGEATHTWLNGDVYRGHWKRGKRDGKGTLVLATGCTYTGEWCMNKPHGEGVATDAKGTVLLRGQWKEGVAWGIWHGVAWRSVVWTDVVVEHFDVSVICSSDCRADTFFPFFLIVRCWLRRDGKQFGSSTRERGACEMG